MINDIKLFTIQEAAEIINCHPNTLRKWDKTGFLSPIRVGKRKDRRYTQEQINAILNKSTKEEKNEENFKIALKDNNIIFFTQDKQLRYTWMYYSHPQFSPDSVVGKTEAEVLGQNIADMSLAIKRRTLDTGQPEKFELDITNMDLKQTYEVRIQPIKDSSGIVTGIAGVAIEITEQKIREEKMKQELHSLRLK